MVTARAFVGFCLVGGECWWLCLHCELHFSKFYGKQCSVEEIKCICSV